MADGTTDTTPGSAPDALRTGSDGSLPNGLAGRRAWVWMQDTADGGGGRFDVAATRVDVWLRKGAAVVPNYPIHVGPAGRTAKPAANLGGRGAGEPERREPETPDGADTTDQAAGEPAAADTTTTTRKAGRTR